MKVQSEAVCFSISKYWSMHELPRPYDGGGSSEEEQELALRLSLWSPISSTPGNPSHHGCVFDVSDAERSSNGEGEDGDVS